MADEKKAKLEIIQEAFAQQPDEVSDLKPVSVEKLIASRPKQNDIVIPVETDEGKSYLLASYPTKRDFLLSCGNLITTDKDGTSTIDLDNASAEDMRIHERALLQRLLKFPAEKEGDPPIPITAEQIEQIDDDLIDDLYDFIDRHARGESEVHSFRKGGEDEEGSDS